MAHNHRRSHQLHAQQGELVVREPQRKNQEVETVVSVVFVTAQNTFPSTVEVEWITPTLANGSPVRVTSAAAAANDNNKQQTTEKAKSTSVIVSKAATRTTSSHRTTLQTTTSGDQSKEILATSVQSTATRLNIAESSGTPSTTLTAASATTTADAEAASSNGGMSVGAKAGLALGILILIGGVLALILVAYKRKKDKNGERLVDDEKAAFNKANSNNNSPQPNQFAAAAAAAAAPTPIIKEPSNPTSRNLNAVPRLSLRPVTEFSPDLGTSKLQTVPQSPATLSPNVSRDLPPSPASSRPSSAWERKGAANAALASPTNPFGDHAATIDSPTLAPAGTMPPPSPAMSERHELPTVSSPVATSPSPEPMNAAVVAGAAGAATAAAAAAVAAGLPKPSPVKADAVEAPLPSPVGSAWTEDIPISPGLGPAPAGAPPTGPLPPRGVPPVGPPPAGAPPVADPAAASAMAAGGAGAIGVAVGGAPGPAGPNNVHRVQMDFVPSMEDELDIRAGQLVRMLHEYDDGWALCVRLDRSQQGVVPRTCLSKHPVKPRVGPPRGPPPPRGPGMGSGAPRPLTPNGRNSPGPGPGGFPGVPRPLTPNGRNSPGPFANQPRPMSPAGRPMPPPGGQPGPRPRANSNASPYGRSMSPGPNSSGQFPAPPDMKARRRSNSASQAMGKRNSPPGPSPLTQAGSGVPRKPVPGQAL